MNTTFIKAALLSTCCLFFSNYSFSQEKTEQNLLSRFTKIEKKTDKFNLRLHMQGGFDTKLGDDTSSKFNMRELRIEAYGKLTDHLSYRWKQKLNRSAEGSFNFDNLPTAIDVAELGYTFNDKWSVNVGKQCIAYGGMEFWLNPIEVYEFSNMLDNMTSFLTGVTVNYQMNPYQQFKFQVTNNRSRPLEQIYGSDVEEHSLPLMFTINWNGKIAKFWETRYSYSMMNQAKRQKMYYLALGNKFTFGKFDCSLDYMNSDEGIDRKGYVSIIRNQYNLIKGYQAEARNVENAKYESYVLKANYRISPKWNVFVKGTYETARGNRDTNDFHRIDYLETHGYYCGAEYYPIQNSNLHFFAVYVHKDHQSKIREVEVKDTKRLSVGFIYNLPMF